MIGIVGRRDSLIATEVEYLLGRESVIWMEAGQSPGVDLDGLVYVACVDSHPSVMEVVRWQLQKSFEISVVGLVESIQNTRLTAGAGIVVLNSAFVGRKHTGGGVAYCAAKAAQRQLILNASVDLGKRLNFIVGIAPAFIDTKPGKRMNTDAEYRAKVLGQLSVREFGLASEVAQFVKYLLFNGRYHNGATLDMSGGWSF